MSIPHMAVRPKDELSTILVPLPLRDHFYVNALLDAAGDEHAPQCSLAIGRQV